MLAAKENAVGVKVGVKRSEMNRIILCSYFVFLLVYVCFFKGDVMDIRTQWTMLYNLMT